MKKLVLDPDRLCVQSFAVLDVPSGTPGTVRAREATVTCIFPRCGTVVQRETCYSGCTYDDC